MKNKPLISRRTFWRDGSLKIPLSNTFRYLFEESTKLHEIDLKSLLEKVRYTPYLHSLHLENTIILENVKAEITTEKQTEANLISAGFIC